MLHCWKIAPDSGHSFLWAGYTEYDDDEIVEKSNVIRTGDIDPSTTYDGLEYNVPETCLNQNDPQMYN